MSKEILFPFFFNRNFSLLYAICMKITNEDASHDVI